MHVALHDEEMWLATDMMPVMMDRGVKEVDGARVMQRPSKKAYALGVEDVREVEALFFKCCHNIDGHK